MYRKEQCVKNTLYTVAHKDTFGLRFKDKKLIQ